MKDTPPKVSLVATLRSARELAKELHGGLPTPGRDALLIEYLNGRLEGEGFDRVKLVELRSRLLALLVYDDVGEALRAARRVSQLVAEVEWVRSPTVVFLADLRADLDSMLFYQPAKNAERWPTVLGLRAAFLDPRDLAFLWETTEE